MTDITKKARLEPEQVDVEDLLNGKASNRGEGYEGIALVAESNLEKVREIVPELVSILEEITGREFGWGHLSFLRLLNVVDTLAHVVEVYPEAVEPYTDEQRRLSKPG